MPSFGKKKDAAPKKPKLTKQEKRLRAEMEAKSDLMRASGIDMPQPVAVAAAPPPTLQRSLSTSRMPSVGYSANKAREKQGSQKKVKLSFKERMTDKVASGMRGTIAKVLNKALGDFIEGIVTTQATPPPPQLAFRGHR